MNAAEAVRAKTENLRKRIDRLQLEGNVSDLSIDGYTVIRDAAPLSFFDELRESVLHINQRMKGFRRFPTNLLNEGIVFEQAVQLEKLNTLYELYWALTLS